MFFTKSFNSVQKQYVGYVEVRLFLYSYLFLPCQTWNISLWTSISFMESCKYFSSLAHSLFVGKIKRIDNYINVEEVWKYDKVYVWLKILLLRLNIVTTYGVIFSIHTYIYIIVFLIVVEFQQVVSKLRKNCKRQILIYSLNFQALYYI